MRYHSTASAGMPSPAKCTRSSSRIVSNAASNLARRAAFVSAEDILACVVLVDGVLVGWLVWVVWVVVLRRRRPLWRGSLVLCRRGVRRRWRAGVLMLVEEEELVVVLVEVEEEVEEVEVEASSMQKEKKAGTQQQRTRRRLERLSSS